MKKQTHWITIPEEKLHTPASSETKKGAQKTGEKPVTNKIFWGAGFVVLVFVSFALLAPSQFSALLKGSLFDTAGVTEKNMQVSLIPEKTKTPLPPVKDTTTPTATPAPAAPATTPAATPADATATAAATATTPAAAPATDNNVVVKPEDQPVDISVKPISTTPPVAATPSAVDCGTDMTCFAGHLKDCSLAKGVMDYKVSDKDLETNLEITGTDTGNCLVKAIFTKSPEPTLAGQEADCKIKQGDYKQEDVTKVFSDKASLSAACNGPATDTLGKYLDSLSATPAATATDAAATATTDAQAKLVDDLKKQIDQLQQQRKDDIKTMQDLAQTSQTQANLYPSAPASGNLPTGVVSTTAIGQPQALQPGFRTNPYKVTITPQQMLQQNLNGGAQYAQQTATQTVYQQQNYQQQYQQPAQKVVVANGGKTPQTGPSEILLITFAITFAGILCWRFVRIVIG
jgi:hypothetical protein